ncbi:MAG: PAAR domain-containing protein [Hyphomicrobium sp.]
MSKHLAIAAVVLMSSLAVPLRAEEPVEAGAGQPGVITEGSDNVRAGGQAAARSGDATDKPAAVIGSSPNVTINGRPAATVGDKTTCGGVVIGGASNVFVNGKPLARAGDLTTGCPGQ